MLAICYLNIDGGIARNCGEVERLLLLAANQDHVDAMYELGLLFRGHYKTGVSKTALRLRGMVGDVADSSLHVSEANMLDVEQSQKWFKRGATVGHAPCQYECGLLCQEEGDVEEA